MYGLNIDYHSTSSTESTYNYIRTIYNEHICRLISTQFNNHLFPHTHTHTNTYTGLQTAANPSIIPCVRITHLSVGILDGWNIALAERALYEAQHERALAHTACPKDHNAIIVALFRHIERLRFRSERTLYRSASSVKTNTTHTDTRRTTTLSNTGDDFFLVTDQTKGGKLRHNNTRRRCFTLYLITNAYKKSFCALFDISISRILVSECRRRVWCLFVFEWVLVCVCGCGCDMVNVCL